MTSRGEKGFSLVELMVAMVIMSIIVASVAQSLILGLNVASDSNTRLTESVGVAFASAYFVPDVESADTVAINTDSGCSVTGTPVARFQWQDSAGTRIATYGVRDHNGERSLVRQFCAPGPQGEIVLTRTIAISPLPVPLCEPVACSVTASSPTTVRLTLNFASGRSVPLSANRRPA